MNLQPEILQHANIPKPLHGMSPRSLRGKVWWDETRKAVYLEQNHTCLACGVHKKDALYHNWIEAHEYYNIDYAKGSMEIEKIVGLCHCCHAYIHSGRTLILTKKGEIPVAKAFTIFQHGLKVLKDADISPWYGHVEDYIQLLRFLKKDIPQVWYDRYLGLKKDQGIPVMQQDWSKWHLILEGERHYSKFKSMYDWENQYN